MKPVHVTVLMGGPSAEREVSLRSGAAVAQALTTAGAVVTVVDVEDANFAMPADTEVAFVALHGTFGEDGQVQTLLEERGIPYIGSGPRASARAFDKIVAKEIFTRAKIATPAAAVLDMSQPDFGVLENMKLPLVVKPARQGSSVGIEIVRRRGELEQACRDAGRYDERLLVEEFVKGRELTVGIFDGRPLPVIEVHPKHSFFNYAAKYTAGEAEYLVPAPIDTVKAAQAQLLAQRAHQCLGCRDFSRVDLILGDNGRLVVLEVNTIPGFTDTSLVPKAARAAGLSFEQLCERLVEMALARRAEAVANNNEEECPAAQYSRALSLARA